LNGLGPPLKLLGLLELCSKLWNTIFPDEFILGLSTETPLLPTPPDCSPAGALLIGLRPTLVGFGLLSDDDVVPVPLGFTILILGR